MSQWTRSALWGLLLSFGLPLMLFLTLQFLPHLDHHLVLPTGHFQVVTAASLLAGLVAILVGLAGRRVRNIQVSLLALAFTSLGLLFTLHGLATPGFILPLTHLPGVAAQLSILVTAGWLWLSACPTDHPWVARLAPWQRWLVPAWAGALVGLDAVLMRWPNGVAFIPVHLSPLKWVAMALTLWLLLLAAQRYWEAYRYARFPLQGAILHAIAWLAGAQVIMTLGELWRYSWWLYHWLLLLAMLGMLYGLVRQYASGASVAIALRGLFGSDPAERIEVGIGPGIRALVSETERHDPYTAGHSYRVALYALQLGQGMGLPPESLRALAQGAIVHDIGKLVVPEPLLNKPGRLTAEERLMIEQHPVTGFERCKRLGFLPEELGIIRHHHERFDGKGYPDRLQGEAIPLLARILAVADVYDALTSERSYRQAWSHEEAMAYLAQEARSQFDPACIAAWGRVMARPLELKRYPDWLHGVGA